MSPSGKSSWFLGVSEGVHPGGGWSVEQTPPPPATWLPCSREGASCCFQAPRPVRPFPAAW